MRKLSPFLANASKQWPKDKEIVFYIGFSKRLDDDGLPTERHREHINQSFNKSHATYEYRSRQFIRLLKKHKIKWQSTPIEYYKTDSDEDVAEEFYTCLYASAGHPICNMAKGLESMPLEQLAASTSATDYASRKHKIERERLQSKLKDKTKQLNRIYWPEGATFTRDQQLMLTDHFHYFLHHHFDGLVGYAQTIKSRYKKNARRILFESMELDTRFVNAQQIKRYLKRCIMEAEIEEDEEEILDDIEFDAMSPAQQEEYARRIIEGGQDPADQIQRHTRGR